MSAKKERVTVTVDRVLVKAGQRAVARGKAESLSAWVNAALSERAEHEQRMERMAEAVAAFEAEFGPISDAEMAAQARADRRQAVVVRERAKPARGRGRVRGAA